MKNLTDLTKIIIDVSDFLNMGDSS